MKLRKLMTQTIALACLIAIAGCWSLPAFADDDGLKGEMKISGRVVESLAHRDLLGAIIYVTDSSGNQIDSLNTQNDVTYFDQSGVAFKRAYFIFKVPRRPAVYNLEVIMDDYAPYYYTLDLKNIGRREYERSLPDFVLKKAPKTLNEVTVTASKVKFYNKGDTIVFNADAFDLAEGSMLDALVKQLPGVEIREGGQIYVNGEFVENLMLNGKDFFRGNNELMLDNLPSYTVKDVQVYHRTDEYEKWAGTASKRELVMDVKLKKEYNTGWIMNFEAGIGSSDRYLARAFINRFTNYSRVSFIGNVNNLNDDRKPGESSTWTPATNTTGTMVTQLGGIDYTANNSSGVWDLSGNAMVRHTSQHDWRAVDRLNFLPDGSRPSEYTYTNNHTRSLALSTSHTARITKKKTYNYIILSGNYNKNKSDVASTGAAFQQEQPGITQGMIDSLYSGGHDALQDLINRTRTTTRNTGHSASGSFSYSGSVKVPKSNDNVSYSFGLSMNESKNEVWRDYVVNYGTDPTPAIRQNQYFDNSPNRTISIDAGTGYKYSLGSTQYLRISYDYTHSDSHQDSYMYALDRLAENGVIGSLPEGYLTTLDASRSYRSHTVENVHNISLDFGDNEFWDKTFSMVLRPQLRILDRNFEYFRNNQNHHVDQKHAFLVIPDYTFQFWLRLGKVVKHNFNLRFVAEPTVPNPVKMVNIVDDNDPMNIWLGNPDLKVANKLQAKLSWRLEAPIGAYKFNNNVELEYHYTIDALVNGYSFNTETGVRTNKTYNVHTGNYVAKVHWFPSLQFGSKGQFTASYFGGLDYIHSTDMIGQNNMEPEATSVYTWWQVHTGRFNWQIGKQQLGLNVQFQGRHTGSEREKFQRINALHTKASLTGQFRLPKGFGISTDVSLYSRSGYGEGIDNTDWVWNARVSYTPPRSRFVLMLDGFDMLHQLTSVNYAIDDNGRTITYTNVLPRYFMFHVQYKLNIAPKKKLPKNIVTFD